MTTAPDPNNPQPGDFFSTAIPNLLRHVLARESDTVSFRYIGGPSSFVSPIITIPIEQWKEEMRMNGDVEL